jgi:hypothetical protein
MRLNDSLWAHRTAFINPMGTTPYKMVYGKVFHFPLELNINLSRQLKDGTMI